MSKSGRATLQRSKSHRRATILGAAAAAALIASGAASALAADGNASEPTTQELIRQIEELKAQVQQLEASQRKQQAQLEQSAAAGKAEVDATVERVLRDARRRSVLLQDGEARLTAGHDGKFFVRSEDGAFSFSPTLQFQLRNNTNWADGAEPDGDDNLENGFEMRRAKFGAEGHVFREELGYKFVWATDRNDGDVFLEDVVVSYAFADDWTVQAGQFKDPVHHEELVSSSRQLAAERSLVNEELGGGVTDRVQGVSLNYKRGPLSVTGMVHDGANSDNTNFRDTPVNDTDYGVAGRVEYLVAGDWKPYGDLTALGNKEDGTFVIGAGADATGGADENLYLYTVDAQWENTTGTHVYAALLGLTTAAHGDGGDDDANDWGGVAQIAQMLNDRWEVFGRGGYIDVDETDDADSDEVVELTGGVNYYFYKHNAKLTGDLTYFPDGAPANTGVGTVDSGDDDQLLLRLQLQLTI